MEPSIQIDQRILISKVGYYFHEPERGDIITFYQHGNREAVPFIKRIIGLPGESVEIKQGIVYIHKIDGNVLPLDEPYIKEAPSEPFKGDTIPENEYFVLGDNRNNSGDSRIGWTVKREDIIGKAWLSIWPPGEWGLAPNYSIP
jgi:signal peptidase I